MRQFKITFNEYKNKSVSVQLDFTKEENSTYLEDEMAWNAKELIEEALAKLNSPKYTLVGKGDGKTLEEADQKARVMRDIIESGGK